MRGTNTGPLRGQFPTGRGVALAGVDVITLADGKIGSVQGYFDRQTMAEQLGLQVIVQPHAIGPFQFGYAARAAGDSCKVPGAVGLTWLDTRSEEEAQQVRELTVQIVAELATAPGFIGWLGVVIAGRMYTITTWETEDAVRAVLCSSAHQLAVKRQLTEDFIAHATTSVWVPHHINTLWTRCTSCGQRRARSQRRRCRVRAGRLGARRHLVADRLLHTRARHTVVSKRFRRTLQLVPHAELRPGAPTHPNPASVLNPLGGRAPSRQETPDLNLVLTQCSRSCS